MSQRRETECGNDRVLTAQCPIWFFLPVAGRPGRLKDAPLAGTTGAGSWEVLETQEPFSSHHARWLGKLGDGKHRGLA